MFIYFQKCRDILHLHFHSYFPPSFSQQSCTYMLSKCHFIPVRILITKLKKVFGQTISDVKGQTAGLDNKQETTMPLLSSGSV